MSALNASDSTPQESSPTSVATMQHHSKKRRAAAGKIRGKATDPERPSTRSPKKRLATGAARGTRLRPSQTPRKPARNKKYCHFPLTTLVALDVIDTSTTDSSLKPRSSPLHASVDDCSIAPPIISVVNSDRFMNNQAFAPLQPGSRSGRPARSRICPELTAPASMTNFGRPVLFLISSIQIGNL